MYAFSASSFPILRAAQAPSEPRWRVAKIKEEDRKVVVYTDKVEAIIAAMQQVFGENHGADNSASNMHVSREGDVVRILFPGTFQPISHQDTICLYEIRPDDNPDIEWLPLYEGAQTAFYTKRDVKYTSGADYSPIKALTDCGLRISYA